MLLSRWLGLSVLPGFLGCLAVLGAAGCAGPKRPPNPSVLTPKPARAKVTPAPTATPTVRAVPFPAPAKWEAVRARVPRPRWATRWMPPAWLNAKGICAFPLEKLGTTELPRTGGQLAASMLGGWKGVFTFREPSGVVDVFGGRYPAVESLTVDLSGAVANPDRKPSESKIPDPVPSAKSLSVEQFTMVAEPLVVHKAKVNMKVTGTDVRFDLQHDRTGRPILMLADAEAGTLHFDVTHGDLERLMLAKAREHAAKRGLGVRSLNFDLRSVGPRSLEADLHVSVLVGFLPAGIRFTARIDVDDRMNARISNLTCEGDEVLGPLIVGFIRPKLAPFEGKTRPLLAFPTGNIKLRDLQVRAENRIELTARFGS